MPSSKSKELTQAAGITADLVLELSRLYSAREMRSLQTGLTSAARELRELTHPNTLLGRIGQQLTREQHDLLSNAAALLDSVKHNVEHAKEKKQRNEKAAKRQQEARNAQAAQLVARHYPLPAGTHDELLAVIKESLLLNRARVYDGLWSPSEHNARLRQKLKPGNLVGWASEQQYFVSCAHSLRHDLLDHLRYEARYDDGSSVEERLVEIKRKVSEAEAITPLTVDEQETLRLWSAALAGANPQEGQP